MEGKFFAFFVCVNIVNCSCETEGDYDLGEINVQEIYDTRHKIRREKIGS